MRNPNRRIHLTLSIGRRNAPRAPAREELSARFGYGFVNHIREASFQTVTGLPALYYDDDTPQTAGASIIRAVQSHFVLGDLLVPVAKSGVPTKEAAGDSPLLLAQAKVQELMAENRRKDEFLALLSHELRSPLCAMGYAVGLLGKQTSGGGPQQPLQALIERQLLRMTQLVDEVLDVSRITNGLLNLHNERVDLRVAVIHAMETLQSDVKGRNQRLRSRLPKDPVWVIGDERRLEQVFVNLIANASRYTDTGGTLIAWICVEGGEAVVRIRDSGIGIAADSLSSIFELFRQADGDDPRSKVGLGVGLALVRQLVELHGGKVTAASDGIGRGSEFKVSLPMSPELSTVKIELSAGEATSRLPVN